MQTPYSINLDSFQVDKAPALDEEVLRTSSEESQQGSNQKELALQRLAVPNS